MINVLDEYLLFVDKLIYATRSNGCPLSFRVLQKFLTDNKYGCLQKLKEYTSWILETLFLLNFSLYRNWNHCAHFRIFSVLIFFCHLLYQITFQSLFVLWNMLFPLLRHLLLCFHITIWTYGKDIYNFQRTLHLNYLLGKEIAGPLHVF